MRAMNVGERRLLEMLLKRVSEEESIPIEPDTLDVEEMQDGRMGSIRFASNDQNRKMEKCVAELSFDDEDGVPVSVALNVDQYGKLFELDVFKADFSSLIRIPEFD